MIPTGLFIHFVTTKRKDFIKKFHHYKNGNYRKMDCNKSREVISIKRQEHLSRIKPSLNDQF